jgi:hypothetical protein
VVILIAYLLATFYLFMVEYTERTITPFWDLLDTSENNRKNDDYFMSSWKKINQEKKCFLYLIINN